MQDENIYQWVSANDAKLRNLFPEQWTRSEELDMMRIGEGLRDLGCDWYSVPQLLECCMTLAAYGIVETNDELVRRVARKVH